MAIIYDIIETVRNFMESGGQVLWAIFFTTLLLWIMIIERFMFFNFEIPKTLDKVKKMWLNREERKSWYAHKIREATVSEIKHAVHGPISLIKMLVALCPLLGLLGTVTGMISVFDVMAVTGTGNARLMASGISMATIPTMAGMVAALSGVFLGNRLEEKAKKICKSLEDELGFDL